MIKYSKNFKTLIGIGTDPFDKLGFENLINNYTIINYEDYPWLRKYSKFKNFNYVSHRDLGIEYNKDFNNRIENVLNLPQVKSYIKGIESPTLYVFRGDASKDIAIKEGYGILVNMSNSSRDLENKYWLRKNIIKELFPRFELINIHDEFIDLDGIYNKLSNNGKVVLQKGNSLGGLGTFIINNIVELKSKVEECRLNKSESQYLISTFIEGYPISIQCVNTKYGLFTNGVQHQIISDPALTDPNANKGSFCGGTLGFENDPYINSQVTEITNQIATLLKTFDFKGIFGLDFMVNSFDKKVYLLELNARITGMTPLNTLLQESNDEIPFILLHFLELANQEYEITDVENLKKYFNSEKSGSYMILRAKNQVEITNYLEPGIYTVNDNGDFTFKKYSFDLKLLDKNDVLIPDPLDANRIVKKGQKIFRIITKDNVFDSNRKVNSKFNKLINKLETYIYA